MAPRAVSRVVAATWVSFCKHYGHGNDAVLSYLSRSVFRTAISNARILGMDHSQVTFRWKDCNAAAWRTERLPGVKCLRRFFLQHVLPRDSYKFRYYRLWHPLKAREVHLRLGPLEPGNTGRHAQPPRMAGILEALSQLTELTDQALDEVADHEVVLPRCPHRGTSQTRFLGKYSCLGVP